LETAEFGSPRSPKWRGDAGRHAILRIEGLVVDAIDAERALLHDAGVFVEFPGAIGTGPGAELAADAEVFVDEDDAVRGALEGRTGRTHRHAGGLGAMQARAREMNGAAGRALADLVGVHAVEPDAVGLGPVRREIGQRRGDTAAVPLLAVHGAGMTADADVEIDDEAQSLLRGRGRQAGHLASPLAAALKPAP
jgi:hypothetical protein